MHENRKNSFNFFNEIKKEKAYRLLFPKPEAGLAIIWLYERIIDQSFPNGEFKEKDIHRAFEEANSRDGKNFWEYNSAYINELHEFFLDYNQEKQVYTLKEYANKFCKQAKDTLAGNFNPTQIEQICKKIKSELELSNEMDELIKWFDIFFIPFQPMLREQIDFLDRQIDFAVHQLRSNVVKKNAQIIEILKRIEIDLDKIQGQNKELQAAFRETDDIKTLLEQKIVSISERKIVEHASQAIVFFKSVKDKLRAVDSKLDRIQPKIQQLFSTLNRPRFNIKVEKFIRFIIEKSDVVRESGTKRLFLPPVVNNPLVYSNTPTFTITKRKPDLFPAKPKKRAVFLEKDESRRAAFDSAKQKLISQDEIKQWVDKIKDQLNRSDQLEVSPIFFEIIKEKNGEVDLPVRVMHRLINDIRKSKTWKLEIEKELITSEVKKDLKIWKLLIKKREEIS